MKRIKTIHILSAVVIILLFITILYGIFSYNTSKTFEAFNQYGESIKMWGSGIYARDSYFKAPIFIGTDITVLIIGIPLMIYYTVRDIRKADKKSRLLLVSLSAWILYYSMSLCFGVTYNKLHLIYTALFSCSLFLFVTGIYGLTKESFSINKFLLEKKYTVFLFLSGISTFIAWLPDIISSFGSGTLSLIEVYTTEITYILDMGIVSPIAFICFFLIRKKNSFGAVLLSVLIIGIIIVGLMMIFQTGVQISAQIDVPIPALITKSLIFLLLGIYAFILGQKLYKTTGE